MAVADILSGSTPKQIVTLLELGSDRWCDLVAPYTFDGVVFAPLDFTARQTSTAYDALEIEVSISRWVRSDGACRLRRVADGLTLYDAPGLTAVSSQSGPGLTTLTLGHANAAEVETRIYSTDRYHGLRRYDDPELPSNQQQGEAAESAGATWYPGKLAKAARDRYEATKANGPRQPTPRQAVLSAVKRVNLIGGNLLARLKGRRAVAVPGDAYTVDASLANSPYPGKAIPQRFGRTVYAPDIAHPPFCTASGTTVTRNKVFCLGIGGQKIYRVWVGGTLAWAAGSSTGAIPGFSLQLFQPGQPLDTAARSDYITLLSGPPMDMGFDTLANQERVTSDPDQYTLTYLPPSGSTETPQSPGKGQFFHVRNTPGSLPVGISLDGAATRSKCAGKLQEAGTSSRVITVTNIPPVYTDITFDSVRTTQRRTNTLYGNATLFTGSYSGGQYVPDLSGVSVSMSGTSYTTVDTATTPQDERQMIIAVDAPDSTPTLGRKYLADLAIRPAYRPSIGDPDAAHLVVSYTATVDVDDAAIVVEAARLVRTAAGDMVPDDSIGGCALGLALDIFDASAIDAASFGAITARCGGVSYADESRWDALKSLLASGSARPVWRAGKLYAASIAAQPGPRLLMTPHDILSGGLAITRSARAADVDAVDLEYTDAMTGTVTSTRYAPAGSAQRSVLSVAMPYCPTADAASRVARDNFRAVAGTSRSLAEVQLGPDGMMLAALDRVMLAAPDYGLGLGTGRWLSGDDWTTTAPPSGAPCLVYVRNLDGSPAGPYSAQIAADGKLYAMASMPAITPPPQGLSWAAYAIEPTPWAVADITEREAGWQVSITEDSRNGP